MKAYPSSRRRSGGVRSAAGGGLAPARDGVERDRGEQDRPVVTYFTQSAEPTRSVPFEIIPMIRPPKSAPPPGRGRRRG